MYIKVTDRCNMRCAHCCVSATGKGRDMSFRDFITSIRLSEFMGELVTIGGGEPTLWKHFGDAIYWLEDEIWGLEIEDILIITNGTRVRNTMRAIRLMEKCEEMCCKTQFRVILSAMDGYHDDSKIHPKVFEYFHDKQTRSGYGLRSREYIRSVRRIVARGRGKNIAGAVDECACPTLHIAPNGDITWCGCDDAPHVGWLGSFNPYTDVPSNYNYECWKTAEPIKEDEEEAA